MLLYNLLECSSNYFDTAGSVWFYSEDKANNFNSNIGNANNLILSCIKLNY